MSPGHSTLCFKRSGPRTVLATALASSPLRLLTPRNHGGFAWVFLASLGGGLVDGDGLRVQIDVEEGASALLGTQACTKVYRSPRGCSQRLSGRVANGGVLAMIPDPVMCFAGARYEQGIDVELAPEASLVLLDGYACGRSARGERWQFAHYSSRTRVTRGGACAIFDATRLDSEHGSITDRMGRFDVVLSLLCIGPRLAPVRDALLSRFPALSTGTTTIAAASPIGSDAAILRVASERLESAMQVLKSSFAALAGVLGDDPLARKW